jgi:acyl-CoA reductase-like NAD-dependent aldehyde dehydrogenase
VAIANSTRYGLSAGLITGEPQLPLGGVKDSGWGRSGPQSMADFTELQWITTRDGAGAYPV